MANPLEQAIASGLKANAEIGASFARLGVGDHPRGFVQVAYRNANRALKQALAEQGRVQAALEVMAGLRTTLEANLRIEFRDMAAFGQEEAARQLGFYGVQAEAANSTSLSGQVEASVSALMARVNAQEAALLALLLSGAEEEEILGNDERAGVLRESDLLANAAYWAAVLTWAGFSDLLTMFRGGGSRFKKQAIAALDSRTTQCCLRVHAQIQPLNTPFKLTGEPRYAERMDWPGFHPYCRTAAVLYLAEYDLGLTAQMRSAADKIQREREAGGSGHRQPAHARS